MKRFISVLLSICALFLFASCSGGGTGKVVGSFLAVGENFRINGDVPDDADYLSAKKMFDDDIDYIIKSHITSNGVKTGWCAQHDPVTYEPAKGREYEPVSISGSESIGIIKILLT